MALASAQAVASGALVIQGQALAHAPLPPTLIHTVDAQADGTLQPRGQAWAQALAPEEAAALGYLTVQGHSEGAVTVNSSAPPPPSFTTGNGWVTVSGHAYGAVSIGASIDRWVTAGGRASSGALAEGQLRIIGNAGQVFAGGQVSVFMIEPPAVIQSYAGISFARINEILALGGHDDTLYNAVTHEPFYLGSQAGSRYQGAQVITERLAWVSRLVWLIHAANHSGLVLNSTAQADYTAVAKLINRLLLTGTAKSYAQAQQQLVDALVLNGVPQALPKADTFDTLVWSARLETLYTAYGALLERLALQGQPSGRYTLTVLLDERFVWASRSTVQAELISQLRDGIGFALHVDRDDGQYVAWVMNTQSRAVHRYRNYPFNSFATLGQRYYGLHSSGLMRLHSGQTDDGTPIAARVRLGLFDLGSRQVKGLPECFFGLSTDGTMLLKVISIDAVSGEKHAAIYQLNPRPAQASRETRVTVGWGLQAVDWDFELSNVDGANFDLHRIEFHPTQLSRRIRG